MAGSFSKKFYASKAWIKCRAAYVTSVFGLCELCPSPGLILHHLEFLTPSNINDPNVTLNHKKLQFCCLSCHNRIHHGSDRGVTAEGTFFDENGDLVERGEAL